MSVCIVVCACVISSVRKLELFSRRIDLRYEQLVLLRIMLIALTLLSAVLPFNVDEKVYTCVSCTVTV